MSQEGVKIIQDDSSNYGRVVVEGSSEFVRMTDSELELIAKSVFSYIDKVNGELDGLYDSISHTYRNLVDGNLVMDDSLKEGLEGRLTRWRFLENQKDELYKVYDKYSDYDIVDEEELNNLREKIERNKGEKA